MKPRVALVSVGVAAALASAAVSAHGQRPAVLSLPGASTAPVPGRVTVIVFWRLGQAFSAEALADLATLWTAFAAKGRRGRRDRRDRIHGTVSCMSSRSSSPAWRRRDARVHVRGRDAGPGTAKARGSGTTVVHWAVRPQPGLNPIDVTLGDPAALRARERRLVFYHEPVLTQEDPPPGMKPVAIHRASSEAACTERHRLEPASEDVAPASPEQSTCYACHARITQARAVHGPTATGYCTICHNPHGSENDFFVKKAVWNLCTTCHFEKGTGRHVVAWGPSGQTHPTRARPDPSRKGKDLSCARCHNPHVAPGARLRNFGAVRWMDLCRNCHPAIFGG